MAGRINKKLVQNQIFRNRSVQTMVRSIVEKEVQKQKLIFKQEFESHPITQELDAGENGSNISGTLGGYGNLFSFLGFTRGSNPTTSVKMLIQNIFLDKNVQTSGNTFKFKINIPSKDEFANVSRLPWETGRSWLLDVERSISGLSAYLYGRFEKSRSGSGIQSRYNYSNRVFKPVQYFGKMYDKFIKKIGA